MAVRSGPYLLAVAFIAAAWVSGASSVPEQAGSSRKSVSCMPCSRTYVADAYFDTLTGQLAEHRDLTEVADAADLCKGLDNDHNVPTVSELHRQLVGEGSHRRLIYSVKFGNCRDDVVKFLDGYEANLVIIEKLPSGVFADPFELQHFVERKVFLDVAVFGDTNLELPSALSNRSAVEIHFDLKPSTSMDCNLAVELPLHARYPGFMTNRIKVRCAGVLTASWPLQWRSRPMMDPGGGWVVALKTKCREMQKLMMIVPTEMEKSNNQASCCGGKLVLEWCLL